MGGVSAGTTSTSAAAQMAVDYLLRTQLASGYFPYDQDFATGQAADMDDMDGMNLVRQAGTVFALSVHEQHRVSPGVVSAVRRGLQAMADNSIAIGRGTVQGWLEDAGLYNRWRLWRVARSPLQRLGLLYQEQGPGSLVTARGLYQRAWPGATAVALLASLNHESATGDSGFTDIGRRWARGLLVLRVPGRGLREAPHYLTESPYVNGEAWLALARYSQRHPHDREVTDVVLLLDSYLMARYEDKPQWQFYAWGTMAAAVRLQATGDRRFLDFMARQHRWLTRTHPEMLRGDGENHCALVEGLATYLQVLQQTDSGDSATVEQVKGQIRQAMSETLRLQIQPGQTQLVLRDGRVVRSAAMAPAAGAFRVTDEAPRIQVDMTGHCIMALAGAAKAGLAWQVSITPGVATSGP